MATLLNLFSVCQKLHFEQVERVEDGADLNIDASRTVQVLLQVGCMYTKADLLIEELRQYSRSSGFEPKKHQIVFKQA